MFSEINAPSIKDLFIKRIESMILSGKLAIGQRLPAERELASQMKISKTAVNGGLQELARRGFLDIRPRKGIFVEDYAKHGTLETLNSIMSFHGGRLNDANEKSILEIRMLLEGPAIERTAINRSEEDVVLLNDLIAEAEAIIDNDGLSLHSLLADVHYRFHHHISVVSGNTIIPLIFNAFKPSTLALWEEAARLKGAVRCVQDLTEIVRLISLKQSTEVREYLENMVLAYMKQRGFES